LIEECDKISYEKILDLDKKSSQRIEEEYSWEKIIEKYEKVF